MQVVCYVGDATFEGDDIEAIADVLVAHVRADHKTQYPEEALRNFARNYAEATERLTGSTERLESIGEITIHPVSSGRVDDWLQLFDHEGFAGNPDWASCYCLSPHQPPTEEEPEGPWRTTRQTMIERLRGSGTYGYLAYVAGRPAGWVNASIRADYAEVPGSDSPLALRHIDPDGPVPESVIGISCYVVAPPYRRHGVAGALADRVIPDAAGRGAAWIEAYPHTDAADAAEAHHFRGARSMYDARGFDAVKAVGKHTLMRRSAE